MGPLQGIRLVEIAGIGPGPFAAMVLSDMGAEIVRIDRPSGKVGGSAARMGPKQNVLNRGRRSIGVDLKKPEGVETVLRLVEKADGLIEGFRPGVMERLGLGPDACLAVNKKLVYGRITGWGQDGPLARAAGHDLNYIALSGVLHAIGREGGKPVPPLNLIGDFGGGGMLLAFGMVCGLLETSRSGKGQVVDAAMVDGASLLMAMPFAFFAAGLWEDRRGVNILDSGAHFYEVYETADGKYVSIGSIEPRFYAELLAKTGLTGDSEFARQMDQTMWPRLKQRLTEVFRQKTRDEWCDIMEGSDLCFAPVMSLAEAPEHHHLKARETFVTRDGVNQPAPAPRFSRTPPEIQASPPTPGEHSREALTDWGFSETEIDDLEASGAVSRGG